MARYRSTHICWQNYLKFNRVLPPETHSPVRILIFRTKHVFVDSPTFEVTQKVEIFGNMLFLSPGFAKFLIFGVTHASCDPLIANLRVGSDIMIFIYKVHTSLFKRNSK